MALFVKPAKLLTFTPVSSSPPKVSVPLRAPPVPIPKQTIVPKLAGKTALTPVQAIGLAGSARGGDPNAIDWITGVQGKAAAGDGAAAGDAHLLSLADAVHVSAEFVAKWFGQAQADTLLPMAHLAKN